MSIRGAETPGIHSQRAIEDAFSLIDRFSTVDGSLSTSQDLRIEGHVVGTLHCDGVLFVAQGADIQADVVADGIVIEGTVSGSIECHGRLEIRASGVVHATVLTRRLVVHEGAVYEGRLEMLTDAAASTEGENGNSSDSAEKQAAPTSSETSYSFLRSFPGTGSAGAASNADLPATDDEDDKKAQ